MTETLWWHSINLGGTMTEGRKSPEILEAEWNALQLGDLTGKTVLDIGCWDGWFSFRAEQDGAAKVTAVDHFVWEYDLPAIWRDHGQTGMHPRTWDGYRRPGETPGMAGFTAAHAALGSDVIPRYGDWMITDLEPADVVIFSGVLYHMPDPFIAVRRLRALTKGFAAIETEGHERGSDPLWEFIGDDRLAGDTTNWWVPNAKGLTDMCVAAGFADAKPVTRVPDLGPYRFVCHATT